MKQSIVKFLEFKGKNLLFLNKEGVYWVAIKPICEVLSLNFDRQYKNIKADAILGPAYAVQPMQIPGDQARKMVCLPEEWIYGWIFSIRSESRELVEYKRECYKILYDHFHGVITNRKELLGQKAKIEMERSKKEIALQSNSDFKTWQDLKASEARIGILLKASDRTEIESQMNLFEES